MFIALDENGNRVEATEANRETQYRCPVCGNQVILRSGLQNADHFAHIANECTDCWNYDMSEWHIKMQSYFPTDTREVVVKHDGSIHRADILIGNSIIEMQHSPISAEEFKNRNDFFKGLGYRVAWVFDVRDKRENNQIQYMYANDDIKLKWSHPPRIFEVLNRALSAYDKSFAVFLHLYDDEYDENPYIYRVVWTRGNADDAVDFSRFVVSEEGIDMGDVKSSDEFFLSTNDNAETDAYSRIRKLTQEASEKGFSYSIKYIGESGKPKSAYTCERTNTFGLKWSGESACCYCKHCAMTISTKRTGKNKLAIYCCYPYIYRKPDESAHPGYECFEADRLRI